jgi:hypothetical protein
MQKLIGVAQGGSGWLRIYPLHSSLFGMTETGRTFEVNSHQTQQADFVNNSGNLY